MTKESELTQAKTYQQEILAIWITEYQQGDKRAWNDDGRLSYLWLKTKGFKFDGTQECYDLLRKLPYMRRIRQKLQYEKKVFLSDEQVEKARREKEKDMSEVMTEI